MSSLTATDCTQTIVDLIERQPIEIAVDTEFKGIHTLTVQVATRVEPGVIAVQVYRSGEIPKRPHDFDLDEYVPVNNDAYGRFCERIILRPRKKLTESLTPLNLLTNLYDISELNHCSLREGRQRLACDDGADPPPNATWDQSKNRWRVPSLRVVFIGHFLTADFGRMFGSEFFDDVLRRGPGNSSPLKVSEGKLIGLLASGTGWSNNSPVVEYALAHDGSLYEIRLETRDTNLPYGPSQLERHSQTFLGLGKSTVLKEKDKRDMLNTFCTKTADAYGYAIVDVINTLLLHEQMKERDRRLYREFEIEDTETPSMRSTLGSRVSTFLITITSRFSTAGSGSFGKKGDLKALLRKGGLNIFRGDHPASRYGEQTGKVHGGLCFSRTPTKLWHEALGMLRDVDMSSCYSEVISGLKVYWGRPVVYEPGSRSLTLRESIEYVTRHAPSDGWYIRVTGDIDAGYNVLIPSTLNAVTANNYRRSRARKLPPGGAKLFSRRIESGIVTHATWLMIRALPASLRTAYEELTADSIVFYPNKMIASDGASFDQLVARYATEALPWSADLDLEAMEESVVLQLDADYVSLAFPLGDYARKIGQLRKEAQAREGRGSGADIAWKLHANTIYGVLASDKLATNNCVAANQITATARAEAFAMMLALNGFQVITDGCTYRKDQIPACTYAECLRLQPDYPLRRADEDSKIPFINPADVPDDDASFTKWFRKNVRRFFEVERTRNGEFIGLHELAHKKTGDARAFDALACDGGGNYVKCMRNGDEWKIGDMAMRGYGRESKEELRPWIVDSYRSDNLTSLSPVTEDTILLKGKEARSKARKALSDGIPDVVLPLGLAHPRPRAYKAIKPSAFVFQTPAQWRTLSKQLQRFEKLTHCGLELLALRRGYGDRRQGSLRAIVERIFAYIQSGGKDLTKHVHLTRESESKLEAVVDRKAEVKRKRSTAEEQLRSQIDLRKHEPDTVIIGIRFNAADLGQWTL